MADEVVNETRSADYNERMAKIAAESKAIADNPPELNSLGLAEIKMAQMSDDVLNGAAPKQT